MIVTVIIPVYNEEKTIIKILKKVNIQKKFFNLQIIVSNDGSNDKTINLLKKHKDLFDLLINSKKNYGKGHAIQVARNRIKGKIILIQDADLEYHPWEIPLLYNSLVNSNSLAVYGSRTLGAYAYQKGVKKIFRYWQNQSIGAWIFNVVICVYFYLVKKIWISDLMTGYKIYNKRIFSLWLPETNGFETDHEITLRILNTGGTILEVPIHYKPRNRKDGKKIRFQDGLVAIKTIFNFRNTH
jgi:glycosyltransferase involved in cell wall biosynthesis